ncbi:hypothetical protein EOK76_g0946 [Lacticaseibacillus paracasei]|nr:hypothetical protein EOK76_g0946 [Lacticaseibacillus paracasei]
MATSRSLVKVIHNGIKKAPDLQRSGTIFTAVPPTLCFASL